MIFPAARSRLPRLAGSSTIERGRGCIPVDAPVFKIGGRWRKAGCGGFDSHAFPPIAPETPQHNVMIIYDGLGHDRYRVMLCAIVPWIMLTNYSA